MERRNFVKYAAMIPAAVVGTIVTGKVAAAPVDDFPKHDLKAHPLPWSPGFIRQAEDRLHRINKTPEARQTYPWLSKTECIAHLSRWFEKYPFDVMSRYVHHTGVYETIGGGAYETVGGGKMSILEGESVFIRQPCQYARQMYSVSSECEITIQYEPPCLKVRNPPSATAPEQTWFFRPEYKEETVERCIRTYGKDLMFSRRSKIRKACYDKDIAQDDVELFVENECVEAPTTNFVFARAYGQNAFTEHPQFPTEKPREMDLPYSHKEYPHLNDISYNRFIKMNQQYAFTEQVMAGGPFNVRGTETFRSSGKDPN